jgi:serine/threonine protein kinase
MTPDDTPPDDDRTVIRPPARPNPRQDAPGTDSAKASAAGPEEPLDNGLPLGTRLGEFELTALLGEGGFGIVYLATDHSLQRQVALKEYMPSALAARTASSQVQVKSERHRETFEAGRKSFINEARLLAQFDHPSLVKVHRFWEANGTAYMVMPYYQGQNLRDTLRDMGQPPDEDWLRRLLAPLTEALLVIHAEQCYHRDIAPDNVMMLAGSQRPLLLDFGAARRVIGDMTQALTVILKPGYAPVEQYADTPGMKQGPWTDVYALAAVVYGAIVGKNPPPSVSRLLNDTYVPLTQAAAGRYSAQFLSAVDRALAVRPEHRTQSMGEFRQDMGLGSVLADSVQPRSAALGHQVRQGRETGQHSPGRSSAAGPGQPAGRRVPWLAVGALVLALAAGSAYMVLTPPARPGSAAELATPGLVPAPKPGPPAALPPAVEATVAAPTSAPQASPAVATSAAAALPPTFDVSQEFARVLKAQSSGFDLRLQTNKTTYRMGKDELNFSIQSEREGYVYVFAYGSDQGLMQLYPNIKQGSLKVRRGQLLKLPQSPDVFESTGPPGPTELLVLVSPFQRDHSGLRPQKDGAYRVFPTGAAAAALASQMAGPAPPLAGQVLCPNAAACVDEFGAAWVKVQVVP